VGGTGSGYERRGPLLGRSELIESSDDRLFAESEFVGRADVPHTTSSAEARIRRRHLQRMVETSGIDRSQPTLELGCADGLVTGQLLDLGFEKLVSTDIVATTLARLDSSLDDERRDRTLLIVDDLLKLPFPESTFATVVAWGVLSVCGDFDRALEMSWNWLAPGGHLLLAEPVLESVLAYSLVRGDLEEFRRILRDGTRPGVWEERGDEGAHRYTVNRLSFYEDRLTALPGAEFVERGGVSMLPSLVLGGVAQDQTLEEAELTELSESLGGEEIDDLTLWRQAYWLVRKG
jgi:SAM-dependent methyltransferase